MTIYDDKTKEIIESDLQFILPVFKPCTDATFKASYIVASNIKCSGKVVALFDLIVLGNIEAAELEVKGKLVCLGKCNVSGSIIVLNEIWANDLRATSIRTHDKIVAQYIDGTSIVADGNIVVGNVLAVEKIAISGKNILCGETAYGWGKIAANTIITGEALDLDDGVEAVISPNIYSPKASQLNPNSATADFADPIDLISHGETEYSPSGNFNGYLDFLTSVVCEDEIKIKFARWKSILGEAEIIRQSGMCEYTNIAMLIWITEIAGSPFFKNWDKINDLLDSFESHFRGIIHKDRNGLSCVIGSFNEWLQSLDILSRYRTLLDDAVYSIAFELVVSNLGLKTKFVLERLNEKGWDAHAE